MERITISKENIQIIGQTETARAIIRFLVENMSSEVTLTVFRQENPNNIKVPAQLNTYKGHKLIGNYLNETKTFEATTIQEEDISEIMTHKSSNQWKSPY